MLREVASDPATELAAAQEHLRQNPDDFISRARRGLVLLLLGRDTEAATDLDEFRRRSPEDAGYLQQVVEVILRRRDNQQTSPRQPPPMTSEAALDAVFASYGDTAWNR